MALGTNIPSKIIERIVPILLTQLQGIDKVVGTLDISSASLPYGVKCNDPVVKDLKKNLEKLKKLINNVKKLVKVLEKIRTGLNITAGIAVGISIAQTLIPLPPFAPPGPIAKLLAITTNLANNCKSAIPILVGLLAAIELAIGLAESTLAKLFETLSSICINEDIEVNRTIANHMINNINSNVTSQPGTEQGVYNSSLNALNGGASSDSKIGSIGCIDIISGIASNKTNIYTNVPSTTDGTGIGATFDVNIVNGTVTSVNINKRGSGYNDNDQIRISGNLLGGISPLNDLLLLAGCTKTSIDIDSYNSIFYTKYNVPADDLEELQSNVDELVDSAKNIFSNIIEAPSQAFIEYVEPKSNIGKTGDFYIDAFNKIVYGPKPSDDTWDTGTKY